MPARFRALLPRRANEAAVYRELFDAMNASGADPIKDLEATVKPWKGEKPSFKKTVRVGGGAITLRIEATGSKEGQQKWSWLDQGTEPHLIVPKGPYPLRFRGGYQAGTRPGTFYSTSGGAYGEEVYARAVHHPGTKARGWTDLLIEKYRPRFWDAVRDAMRRAAKKSGHGE